MLSQSVSTTRPAKNAPVGLILAVKGFLRKRISTGAPGNESSLNRNYLTHTAVLLTKNSKMRRGLFLQGGFRSKMEQNQASLYGIGEDGLRSEKLVKIVKKRQPPISLTSGRRERIHVVQRGEIARPTPSRSSDSDSPCPNASKSARCSRDFSTPAYKEQLLAAITAEVGLIAAIHLPTVPHLHDHDDHLDVVYFVDNSIHADARSITIEPRQFLEVAAARILRNGIKAGDNALHVAVGNTAQIFCNGLSNDEFITSHAA